MKQFVLDHFQSVYCAAANCRLDTDAGDLLIELAAGQKIALIVINRAVHFAEVKARYENNTAHKIHTLFLLDQRMLPPDGSEVELPAWLLTLHAVNNGRVYGYTCDRRAVTIRPLHFGWKWGSKARSVEFGAAVDTRQLAGHWNETAVDTVPGLFATAHFAEGEFWKKQDPRGPQQRSYSWRAWRYSERKNTNTQQEADDSAEWDAWEEVYTHYGRYEDVRRDEYTPPHGASHKQDTRRQSRDQRRAQSTVRGGADRGYYALLGIPVNASLEEVKQAYRRKAREYHPDLHPDQRDIYTAKMTDINVAFEEICKKLRR